MSAWSRPCFSPDANTSTAADMLTELMASLGDQSLYQKLKQYTSPDILLIELGFDRLEQQEISVSGVIEKI